MEIKQGSVVISKAGRDKGYFLAVIKSDGKYALVCDGGERPLENPKRKNIIHLSVTRYVLDEAQTASNQTLRKALNSLRVQKPEQREVK